jgi:hypothetical protein
MEQATQSNVPDELLDQLRQGNVLLFVGEGVNRGMAGERGLPSSAELAAELAQRCQNPPHDPPLTLPRVAMVYEHEKDRAALFSFLREKLGEKALTPLRAHQLMCKLPVPVIVTTTYDDLIERAHRLAEVPYVSQIRSQDVPHTDRQKRQLIWLLGRLDRVESLAVTEDDLAVLDEQRSLSDILRAELAQRTWLILGYDLSAEWFRRFYAGVMRRLDHQGRRAYFYGECPSSDMVAWCQLYNIQILTPDLTTFLFELSSLLGEGSDKKQPPVPFPDRPYKGLKPFAAADQPFFFGRERETPHLSDLVRAHRLVILYGASGTGKTSLIQAGLVPWLERDQPPYTVVTARALGDPIQAIRVAVTNRAAPDEKLPAGRSLVDFLAAAARLFHSTLVLVLDQFEELYVQSSPELRAQFRDELAQVIQARDLPVKLVLSLREEWLAALGEFESAVPNLYDARFRLTPLDREAARAAIEKPVVPFGIRFEATLVDRLLDDLGGGTMLPLPVQLVCDTLYSNLLEGQREITLAAYQSLNGARGILGHFLRDELERVPSNQRELAQHILEQLVSSQGTKIAKTAAKLGQALEVDTEQVQPVLDLLAGRLLNVLSPEGGAPLYELAHEYLVGEIRLSPDVLARKQAEELLAQGVDNWKRLGTLLGADALAIIDAQRISLHPGADELEFLLRSAVQHGRETDYWVKRLQPDSINALVQRLRQDLKSKQKVKSQAHALLWALRRYLPRSLVVPVYGRQLSKQTPFLAGRLTLLVALATGVLLVLNPQPIDTGWPVMTSLDKLSQSPSGVRVVAADLANPDVVYAADQTGGGLYQSLNGGLKWFNVANGPLREMTVNGIAAVGQQVYVTAPDGVYVSRDQAVQWLHGAPLPGLRNGQEPQAIAVNPHDPLQAYAGVSHVGVFATADGGQTWLQVESLEIGAQSIRAIATDGQHVVVALEHEMQISRNAGQTWTSFVMQPALPETVQGLAMPGQTDDLYLALGINGIGIASIQSGQWGKWEQSPSPALNLSAISVSLDKAQYAVSPRGLLCHRRWYVYQREWWLRRLGLETPCHFGA